MITYVNTVLVANGAATVLSQAPAASAKMATPSADAGKFIIINCDHERQGSNDLYTIDANTQSIKIGLVTSKNTVLRHRDGSVEYQPIVRWSNVIKKHDIKSFHETEYFEDTEDTVEIDLTNAQVPDDIDPLRFVLKLTYKDMPHRYRKWTESYEYVTSKDDDLTDVAKGLADAINGDWKRARVYATANGAKITLEAMPYDDAVQLLEEYNIKKK